MKREGSATTNPGALAGSARSACEGSYRLFGLAGSSRFCGIIRHFGETVLIRMRKLLLNGSCRRHMNPARGLSPSGDRGMAASVDIGIKNQSNRSMKLTLQTQLLPDADQSAKLRATVERFNEAATWLAGIAFERKLANKF